MKYRPNYPGTFSSLEQARAWVDEYVISYNHHHAHSALGLFTPHEVHTGTWEQAWHQRDKVLQAYHQAHPERFRKPPTTPAPAGIVGINLPKKKDTN